MSALNFVVFLCNDNKSLFYSIENPSYFALPSSRTCSANRFLSGKALMSKQGQVCGRLSRLATDWLTDNEGGVPVGVDGVKAGTGKGAEEYMQERQQEGGAKKMGKLQQNP